MNRPLCLLQAAFLCLAAAGPAAAQSLSNREVEGLCIVKDQPSLPDQAARMFEYRATIEYPTAFYVFPVGGQKMRIAPGTDASFIPYPGRGDIDRKTALVLVGLAERRFPQYGKILGRVREAWLADAAAAARSDEESRHRKNAEKSVQSMSQGRSQKLPAPEIPASVLPPASLQPASLKNPPAKPAASPAQEPAKPASPASLEENLKTIRTLYESAGGSAGTAD